MSYLKTNLVYDAGEECPRCHQTKYNTGEYPCPECGRPMTWDEGSESVMSFPDVDEIEEGKKYPDLLYLDSELMEGLFQVYVYAEGLDIEFRRPGHNLELHITQHQSLKEVRMND